MSEQLRMFDSGDGGRHERRRTVRSEEATRELIHRLDILTDALNQVRTRSGHRLGGLVRWALPRVIEERNRLSDELALRRAR
jgi:hypothetical protein